MSLNSLGLGFMFTATDLASGVMDKVKGNLESLSEASGKSIEGIDTKLQRFGAGVTAMAIGIGGLSAGFAMASKYGEFESAIAAVGAVSNATAEELAALKEAAIQAGVATQFSPTEATLGLNELAQAGFSAKEQIELLRPALDLAAGSLGQLSPQDAAGLAAQAIKAFGLETWQAKAAVDQMLQASNAFAMRADDLPLALGIASRGAQSLNQSLTETVIAVGMVKNVVPGTERAATSVAVAMEKMANPKVQKALHSIGVAATDATGNFRPFLDILGDMIPALDKMSLADRSAFLQKTFGAESLGGLNAILSQVTTGIKTNTGETVKGAAALAYLRNQFMSASGVAEDFSKKLLDTYEGQKKLLSGSVETLAIKLGEPFAKALRPAIELAVAAINGLINLVSKVPMPVLAGGAAVVMLAFGLITLGGAIVAAQAIWPIFVAGIGMAVSALGSLAVAAWAAIAPLLPFILIGAAVIAVVLAITQNWWGLQDALVTGYQIIWDTLVGFFKWFLDVHIMVFKAAWGAISWFGEQLWGFAKSAYEAVASFASAVFEVLSYPFKLWWDFMVWQFDLVVAIFDLVAAALGYAWAYVVDVVTDSYIWKSVVAGVELINAKFTEFWNGAVALWGSGVSKVTSIWDEATAYVTHVWDQTVKTWQAGVGILVGVWDDFVYGIGVAMDFIREVMTEVAIQLATPWVIAFQFVEGVVTQVANYALGIVDRVKAAVSSVFDWLVNLGAKIGGFFADLPGDIHAVAADVRAATPGGTTMADAAAGAPAASASSMPAVAAAQAASAPASAPRGVAIDYDKLAGAMSKRPINTVVEIDGEAVASATANAQRSNRARAGMPVGAEAAP